MTSTNLPATTSFSIPTLLRQDVAAKLHSWTYALSLSSNGRSLSRDAMPNADQRGLLERRCVQIVGWQQPILESVLRTQLQGLLGSLKGRMGSEEDVEAELAIFSTVLRAMPAHAVIAACKDYLLGRRGEGGWRPTPPELRSAAMDHVAVLGREQREIEAVLSAEPEQAILPEERKRNVAGFAILKVELAEKMNADRSPRGRMSAKELTQAQAEAQALHQCVMTESPDLRPMPKLSPEHRAALGLPQLPDPEPDYPDDYGGTQDAAE